MDNSETWKDVPGFVGLYKASDKGRVKSVKSGRDRAMSQKRSTDKGYKRICLTKDGVQKSFFVHVLIAKTFLENPKKSPIVNHKNKNKADNCVENLEWATHKYNTRHGRSLEGVTRFRDNIPVANAFLPLIKKLVPFKTARNEKILSVA